MRRKLVVGNWKMHGSVDLCRTLIPAFAAMADGRVQMVVCPPAGYLPIVGMLAEGSPLALGAQNTSPFAQGAHTGEISSGMLADLGCNYVIVGHSERRTQFAEGDEVVAAKARAALDVGLAPIYGAA